MNRPELRLFYLQVLNQNESSFVMLPCTVRSSDIHLSPQPNARQYLVEKVIIFVMQRKINPPDERDLMNRHSQLYDI